MARTIDSEVAYQFLTEQFVKETGAFSKGVNKGLNIARSAMRNPDAIPALRPVSREQVEKVWRGCEKCNGAGEYSRYAENLTKTLLAKYCPHCGRPLTDEAVQMVMERMEALEDGKGD